jgi:hypothetical protein
MAGMDLWSVPTSPRARPLPTSTLEMTTLHSSSRQLKGAGTRP